MQDFLPALGIDYGTKRIGVAVAVGPLAEPLQIIDNTQTAAALKQLVQLCADRQIKHLVVGMSERAMAHETEAFAKELAAKTNLDMSFIDEAFSSVEMTQKLRQGPMRKSRRSGSIDHFVAADLLQQWIDESVF